MGGRKEITEHNNKLQNLYSLHSILMGSKQGKDGRDMKHA
jgi:hypothetical protein